MTQNYMTCLIRQKAGDQMAYKKKSEDEIEKTYDSPTESEIKIEEPKPQKSKSKKQICNVIYKADKKFSINFNGDGISLQDSSPIKTDKVEITYEGEYSTPTFKIISHKFI